MPRRLRTAALTLAATTALTGALVGAGSPAAAPERPRVTATEPTEPTAAPEPTAAVTPVAGAATMPALSVVGLGDSVVSGTACRCTPYVQRYAGLTRSATGRTAVPHNLGVGGLTSSQLLSRLAPGSPMSAAVRGADIVTVTIGANDLAPVRAQYWAGTCQGCFAAASADVRRHLVAILDRIAALRAGHRTEVMVTTYWNVFKEPTRDSSWQYDAMVDRATSHANAAICAAARLRNVACIDLYAPFKNDVDEVPAWLLAPDRDHPSAAGHALIARELARHAWHELGLTA